MGESRHNLPTRGLAIIRGFLDRIRGDEKDMTRVPPVDDKSTVPVFVKFRGVGGPMWVYQTAEQDIIPEG